MKPHLNPPGRPRRRAGTLLTEALVALGILMLAAFPLSFAFVQDAGMARTYYHRAVAMEIVDGELEILAAGEWRAYRPGRQQYRVSAVAATNLPPGRFTLELTNHVVRLEWRPSRSDRRLVVTREVRLP